MKETMKTARRVLALAAMAALGVTGLAMTAAAAEFEVTAASMTVDNQVNFSSTVIMQKAAVAPANPNNNTTWGAGNAGGLYFDGNYKVWEPGSSAWVVLSTAASGGTGQLSNGQTNAMPYWTGAATLGNSQMIRDGGASFTIGASSLTVNGNMALTGANAVLTSSGIAGPGTAGVYFSTSVYLTGTSSVTAGYFIGSGAGLTAVPGTLSGGSANAVPYWTGANAQGNSQLIRDSANSMTVGGSSFTVAGQAYHGGSVNVASATLTINGSGGSLNVVPSGTGSVTLSPAGTGGVTISPAGASVTIGPGGSNNVSIQPGGDVVISPAAMGNGLTVKRDGANVIGFWQGSYEMFKFKQ